MMRLLRMPVLAIAMAGLLLGPARGRADAPHPWVTYQGREGPGKGKKVVLIAADDEYRSEELIPALAKILAVRHGFDCTVLFAVNKKTGEVDPSTKDNIPGIEALDDADLIVLFARFRELPDDQMKHFVDYVESGRPIVALRTSTHAFLYNKKDSPYARYSYNSQEPRGGFGRLVLGETWVSHHGHHKVESTRGIPVKGMESHPILKGVKDIWGPSDVYTVNELPGDSQPVVMGQVLKGMKPDDEPNPAKALMPIAWTKTYTGSAGKPARIFTTTMGHAGDFKNEGVRRMLVNACYWCLGMEDQIDPDRSVELVGRYDPPPIGEGGYRKGVKPEDLALPKAE
jgi:type 1 glutamine amidotransferase